MDAFSSLTTHIKHLEKTWGVGSWSLWLRGISKSTEILDGHRCSDCFISARVLVEAMPKMPQFSDPHCSWVSIYLRLMVAFGVASRAAIWFIMCDVGAQGRLSKTLTSPCVQSIVGTVTTTLWRPVIRARCLLRTTWAGLTTSVSQSFLARIAQSLSVKACPHLN